MRIIDLPNYPINQELIIRFLYNYPNPDDATIYYPAAPTVNGYRARYYSLGVVGNELVIVSMGTHFVEGILHKHYPYYMSSESNCALCFKRVLDGEEGEFSTGLYETNPVFGKKYCYMIPSMYRKINRLINRANFELFDFIAEEAYRNRDVVTDNYKNQTVKERFESDSPEAWIKIERMGKLKELTD
jgi:hypothetical protein